MRIDAPRSWKNIAFNLRFSILFLLCLGVSFRLGNLGSKFFWHDEVYTLIRVAGYHYWEIVQQLFSGEVVGVEDLQKFQRLSSERNVLSTVESLATSEPQITPLYYVIAYYWVLWFGNSITAIRSLSAIISLFVFPCTYWLCIQLFKSPLAGWITIMLIAISPFNLLFAQEARFYSLWIVTVLLSSNCLLRATHKPTKLNWGLYSASLAVALYTNLLSGLVLVSHGLYLFFTKQLQWSKALKPYLLSSLFGFCLFIPWILILRKNFGVASDATAHTTISIPLDQLVRIWLTNLSRVFIDVNLDPTFTTSLIDNRLVVKALLIFVLIFTLYSIHFLIHAGSREACFFILCLIITTSIPLVSLDLVWGGVRSATYRYLIPAHIGIQLAMSYLLSSKLISTSSVSKKKWHIILTVFILMGLASCFLSFKSATWWNKFSDSLIKVPEIVNRSKLPLIISSIPPGSNMGELIALSYLLNKETKFQLFYNYSSEARFDKVESVAAKFSDLFLFNPSPQLRLSMETRQKCRLKPIENLDPSNPWLLVHMRCPNIS